MKGKRNIQRSSPPVHHDLHSTSLDRKCHLLRNQRTRDSQRTRDREAWASAVPSLCDQTEPARFKHVQSWKEKWYQDQQQAKEQAARRAHAAQKQAVAAAAAKAQAAPVKPEDFIPRALHYDEYERCWAELRSGSSSAALRFRDIPWPPDKNVLYLEDCDTLDDRKRKV
eukprot:SM004971S17353  [mRNA]  locus=s4971:170:1044:+ [translate_table: standard]